MYLCQNVHIRDGFIWSDFGKLDRLNESPNKYIVVVTAAAEVYAVNSSTFICKNKACSQFTDFRVFVFTGCVRFLHQFLQTDSEFTVLLVYVCRLGSFGREHALVRDKHKKDKDKYREKSGGKDKSPHGDVILRPSLSWDLSSPGE